MRTLAVKEPSNTQRRQAEVNRAVVQPSHRSLSSGVLQRKAGCACGGGCPRCQEQALLQTKLKISEPGDQYEQEADLIADEVMQMPEPAIQRQMEPAEDEEEEMVQRQAISNSITPLVQRQVSPDIEDEEEDVIQTKTIDNQATPSASTQESSEVPHAVHEVLRSPGQPLDPETLTFMEPRFGQDFSQVRVHTDEKAAESAQAVSALAYSVGQDIVFGVGQFQPQTGGGQHLLAHELTHVVQQGVAVSLQQAKLKDQSIYRKKTLHARKKKPQGKVLPAAPIRIATIPSPEICPPPKDIKCSAAIDSPGAVTNTFIFPVNDWDLNPTQQAEVDATVAAWHAAGGSVTARIDGFASAEGECGYNWNLSCLRAKAVASELESPSDGTPGVPMSYIQVLAHGESDVAGRALESNRQSTISMPTPPTPVCKFPVRLGSARGCGSGTDFTHFDFPSISPNSTAKLAAWAAAHPSHSPFRSMVTDTECEVEMDVVLGGLAGAEGHAAFSRFAAGTGGTVTHGSSSTLGAMALTSGSFLRTVGRVQADIEAQLATQAISGVLDACALSVTPPPTFFAFSDGASLKAVIGGTQAEQLFATSFTGSIPLRSYSIDLRFIICDDFGVDESDLYAPGLFPFWVLQHERSATKYAPFINELDITVTVSGAF